MNIKDQGIILSVKKYSENSLIVKILSPNNGIYSGFVKGALSSKKNRFTYQIANLVEFNWQAKLEENLGFFRIELIKSYLAEILSSQIKLNCLITIISIIEKNVPERQADENLFSKLLSLLNNLNNSSSNFISNYIKLELELLNLLGYGIDLSKCAASGITEGLCFVSPKTGRAVSWISGEKYSHNLLKLPEFLIKNQSDKITKDDLLSGLTLSGFFIEKYLYHLNSINIPNSRGRLINLIKNENFDN